MSDEAQQQTGQQTGQQASQEQPAPPEQPTPPGQQPNPNPPAQPTTGFGGATLNTGQQQQQQTGFGGEKLEGGGATPPQPVDPASYAAFTVPAGTDQTDPNFEPMMQAFRQSVATRGLSQEQAQGVMDIIHELDAGAMAHEQQAVTQRQQAWEAEAKAQGVWTTESLNAANAGLVALDGEGKLTQALGALGLLSHPALIQAFGAYHAYRQTPQFARESGISAGQGPAVQDMATALYGPVGA